jgi:GNAT superfamily N-acetyltransferase
MSRITVSQARPQDIDPFVASVLGLFQEDGGRHDPFLDTGWPTREGASYYAGLVDDPDCLLAVARDGEHVVGHLVGKLVGPDSIRLARFAVLESMRVQPMARGQGVGSRLVEEFLAWARQRQAVQASVTAYAANNSARRFYARHGFAPASVTMRAPL